MKRILVFYWEAEMGTAPARARLGVLLVILGFRTECSTASGTAENGVVSLRIAESRA